MLGIGKIIAQIIQKNRDATAVSRMYQVQGDESEDLQEFESIEQTGVQSRAPVDSQGIFARISAAYKVLIGFKDGIAPFALDQGERIAYASDAGAMTVSVYYKKDGTLVITAPIKGVEITGPLKVTGPIECDDEIIADLEITAGFVSTPIEVTQHPHIGDLGFNTGPPVVTGGGVSPPSNPPTTDANGDVVTGTNATSLDSHDHPYTWTDPAGSGNTGPPN